jgi:thymidylate kinase
MAIIIVEGADGVGKTTSAKAMAKNGLYIHFPIRSLTNDVIANFSSLTKNSNISEASNFSLCKPLNGLSMNDIQDTILANIEANCAEIMRLHELGVTVVIDRFTMSNYVYRKIFCNEQKEFINKPRRCQAANAVIDAASIHLKFCNIDIIKSRLENKADANSSCDLDMQAEQINNIAAALKYFRQIDANTFCLPPL